MCKFSSATWQLSGVRANTEDQSRSVSPCLEKCCVSLATDKQAISAFLCKLLRWLWTAYHWFPTSFSLSVVVRKLTGQSTLPFHLLVWFGCLDWRYRYGVPHKSHSYCHFRAFNHIWTQGMARYSLFFGQQLPFVNLWGPSLTSVSRLTWLAGRQLQMPRDMLNGYWLTSATVWVYKEVWTWYLVFYRCKVMHWQLWRQFALRLHRKCWQRVVSQEIESMV